MEVVTITDEMVQTATAYENAVLSTDTIKNTENRSGHSAPRRYYIGSIGEQAFARYLDNAGIGYQYQPKADGRSDEFDFVLSYGGNPYRIDVKTTASAGAAYLSMPAYQAKKQTVDAFVGVVLREDEYAHVAQLRGIISRDNYAKNAKPVEKLGGSLGLPLWQLANIARIKDSCFDKAVRVTGSA